MSANPLQALITTFRRCEAFWENAGERQGVLVDVAEGLLSAAEVDREPSTESREAGGDTGGGAYLEAIGDRGIDVDRLGMEVQEVLPRECSGVARVISATRPRTSAPLATWPTGRARNLCSGLVV